MYMKIGIYDKDMCRCGCGCSERHGGMAGETPFRGRGAEAVLRAEDRRARSGGVRVQECERVRDVDAGRLQASLHGCGEEEKALQIAKNVV